jgi:hypothetical protein
MKKSYTAISTDLLQKVILSWMSMTTKWTPRTGGSYSPSCLIMISNSKNEIIGWYEVCFECARIASIPEFKVCRKGGLNDRGLDEFARSVYCLFFQCLPGSRW